MTRVLVTGASGFLGQYVVAQALRQGYKVRAIIRNATNEKKFAWCSHPSLELVRLDLRQKKGILEALEGIDSVIHLAAAKVGDFYTQFAGTVVATENLLNGMIEAQVWRLVAISTFSVYDGLKNRQGELIDENAQIEQHPIYRDEYAQTKLIQEKLIQEFENNHPAKVTIIRPGIIYGRDNLWNAHLGAQLGDNLWLKIGGNSILPLTYVENCAQAIVKTVDCQQAYGKIINIVDDDLPTQNAFLQKLLTRTSSPPRLIPVSWPLMRFLAGMLWFYNQRFLKGQAKFPGIFVPSRLAPRFKAFCYSNQSAKEILNWTPTYSLDTALDRSCSSLELLNVLD